jgi:hypothetical protein
VFYEIAGTIGPVTAVKLMDDVGENLSFFLSPVSLALAGLVWFFIRPAESQHGSTLSGDTAVATEMSRTPVKEPGYLKRYRKVAYFNQRWAYSDLDSCGIPPSGVNPLGMEVRLCLATAASSGLSPATHLHFLRTGKRIAF